MGDVASLSGRPGGDFLHTIPASLTALQDMKQVEAMIQRLELRKKQQSASSGNAAAQHVDLSLRSPMDGRQLGQQIGEEVTRMMLDNLTQDERLLGQVRTALQAVERGGDRGLAVVQRRIEHRPEADPAGLPGGQGPGDFAGVLRVQRMGQADQAVEGRGFCRQQQVGQVGGQGGGQAVTVQCVGQAGGGQGLGAAGRQRHQPRAHAGQRGRQRVCRGA